MTIDASDTRPGENAIGPQTDLRSGQRARFHPTRAKSDGEEGRTDLLAGGYKCIGLPRIRLFRKLMGESEESVGFATHRRDHDHQRITIGGSPRDSVGDVSDSLDGSYGRSAEFLYHQGHRRTPARGLQRATRQDRTRRWSHKGAEATMLA